MSDYVAVVNLVPSSVDTMAISQVVGETFVRRETIAFSIDDAITLVSSGLPGSTIKVWGLDHFNIGDIDRLDSSGLNLEHRHLAGYRTAKLYLSESLPKNITIYGERELDAISVLTIHHTVGWDFEIDTEQNAKNIANYHVNTKGWPGIGYHFLIGPNGEIISTNELETISYHAGTVAAPGDENLSAVGIALGGDFRSAMPPEPQISAARRLVEELKRELPSQLAVLPHKRMPGASTICPGTAGLETWLKIVAGQ